MKKDKYVSKAISVHGDKYGYDKVPDEFSVTNKIDIFCKYCGRYFSSIARNHTNNNSGCPICARKNVSEKMRKSFEYFISKAKIKHGTCYEYFKEKFVRMNVKTEIKCNKCGNIFRQNPSMHLIGNGCPYCHKFPKKYSNNDFKKQLKKEHVNLELIGVYNGNKEYVNVRCNIHNYEFNTKPNWLHKGNGCPICSASHLETKVYSFLKSLNILFFHQKSFDWLNSLSLDFYIPSLNLAIECQGIQHFKPIEYFGGIESLIKQEERDDRKFNLCKNHTVSLLYVITCEDEKMLSERYNNRNVITINSFEKYIKKQLLKLH